MVTLEMQGEMVGACERSTTRPTSERLVTGVFAEMTSQFVGPREPPLTAFPRAPERTLSYTQHTIYLHAVKYNAINTVTG